MQWTVVIEPSSTPGTSAHPAICYPGAEGPHRVNGVKPDIYNEGTHLMVSFRAAVKYIAVYTCKDPMV